MPTNVADAAVRLNMPPFMAVLRISLVELGYSHLAVEACASATPPSSVHDTRHLQGCRKELAGWTHQMRRLSSRQRRSCWRYEEETRAGWEIGSWRCSVSVDRLLSWSITEALDLGFKVSMLGDEHCHEIDTLTHTRELVRIARLKLRE